MPVRCGGLLVLALVVASPAVAQDSHYWTRQFGNRAWLLGGALLGSPDDISAVYYNPGALALVVSPEVELTGNVFEFSRVSVANGLGLGKDLSTSRFSALPALIAGPLRFGWLGKSRMGYALITRQGFSTRLRGREEFSGTDLLGVTGLEQLSADVKLEHSVSEFWAGVSWAYPLTRRLGVGGTPFVALRQQSANFLSISQGAGSGGQTLLATLNRDYHLQHARLLAKLGVNYQEERWAVGVTVTTPSLALFGHGDVGFERALSQQGFQAQAPTRVSHYQKGAKAHFDSALAVGLGGNRRFGSTTVHVAVEGFLRVHTFQMIDTDPVLVDAPELELSTDVFYGLKPVVNVALGVEQRLGPKVRVFLSGHTDFSGAVDLPNTSTVLSTADLYHAATGVYFPVGRSRFTVGADLAWGRQTSRRLSDILTQSGIQVASEAQDIRFFQAALVLGASFGTEAPEARSSEAQGAE